MLNPLRMFVYAVFTGVAKLGKQQRIRRNVQVTRQMLAVDSLYRNSLFLIASTAVMAVGGFAFWLLSARLVPIEQTGNATALVSTSAMIASFSLLGLNLGVIRHLPDTSDHNETVNTVLTLTSLTASLFSVAAVFVLRDSVSALPTGLNFPSSVWFIAATSATSLGTTIEGICMAHRAGSLVLVKNALVTMTRLILCLPLASIGTLGVFVASTSGAVVVNTASLFVIARIFDLKLRVEMTRKVVVRLAGFSLGNYVANFLWTLPTLALPVLLSIRVTPQAAAYFYMDSMVVNLIYIVPTAAAQSLLAEGVHSQSNTPALVMKAVKITTLLTVPAVVGVLLCGEQVLSLFGEAYSAEGSGLLKLMAFSTIPGSICLVGGGVLNILNKVRLLMILSLVNVIAVLGLSVLWMTVDITGIGWAWLVGQSAVAAVYVLVFSVGGLLPSAVPSAVPVRESCATAPDESSSADPAVRRLS